MHLFPQGRVTLRQILAYILRRKDQMTAKMIFVHQKEVKKQLVTLTEPEIFLPSAGKSSYLYDSFPEQMCVEA